MNALVNQLKESSALRWFSALSNREKGLIVGAIVVFVAVFLVGYALPTAQDYRNSNVAKYKESLADLQWMKAYEDAARSAVQSSEASGARGGDVQLSTLYESAQLHDVEIQRATPSGQNVNIEVTQQSFDSVLSWIFSLQNDEGIAINQVRINRLGSGMVDVRLVVRKG